MNDRWYPSSGDLIYVPSEVNLIRTSEPPSADNRAIVTDYLKLKTPATMLVSATHGDGSNYVEVIYRGAKWSVDTRETYPVKQQVG